LLLGPEVMHQNLAVARQEALDLLPLFGLDGFADAYPSSLSGGMRQRAALLRTMLCKQDLILLDEPFGALDALTRRTMRTWLLQVWERFRQTVLFVTHDVEEAVYLADRVYLFSQRPGRILLEIKVEFPRPRASEILTDPRFIAYRQELLAALGV
jgi:ABC-type nitrate/sulfonate/bicarbonate transport system ATPase subunit